MNISILTGFFSLVYRESRLMMKDFLTSYTWFILLISISAYSLFVEKYANIAIDSSFTIFRYDNHPMADILTFTTSSAISSHGVLSGKYNMMFPISIGVAFFIVFPLMLGLNLMGKFIIKKASTIIAGEKEKKTLYILTASPQTRSSIYLGKFTGLLLLTLPMIFSLYAITWLIFTDIFPSAFNLSGLVLETAIVTAFLFISGGMLVSVLCKNEKRASSAGSRITAAMAALTTIWIFIPLIGFLLSITNSSTYFLPYIEKIVQLSPFTQDLMSAYNPAVLNRYIIIQIIASIICLIAGMVTFIIQDIEY